MLAAGAVLISLVGGGCKKKAEVAGADASDSAVAVKAEHPTTGDISDEIAGDAILNPLAQAALAARISAPIRAEYVQRGARVHKGQLLVTLEDRDLQGSAIDSQGAVSAAQAAYTTATQATIPEDLQKSELDVRQAKANLEVANRTAEERKKLLRDGAIAGRDADTAIAAAVQAQATYDTAVKHLQSVQNTTRQTSAQTAEAQLTSARGKLMNAEAQVSFANLKSPIDGVVTDRPLFPGETAQAGAALVTIMDTSSLIAKLHIAQSAAQKLRVGAEAEVSIPGEDASRKATVMLVSPALDPGSTTVEVWLKLPNRSGLFKAGTPVHTVLHGKTVPNALQLPTASILPSEDGGTSVLVVGSDNTVKKRAVTVGLRTPDKVQILSGVSAQDLVVTEGGYGLDDGTKVKPGSGKDDAGDEKGAATADKGGKD
jgi:HlyD family secretion protein